MELSNYFEWLEKVGATTHKEIIAKTQSSDETIQFEFLQLKDPAISMYPLNTRFRAKWKAPDEKAPEGSILIDGAEIIEVLPMSAKKKHNLVSGANLKLKVKPDGTIIKDALRRGDLEYNPFTKYPVNSPCFCGTGKKFKKCHKDVLTPFVLKKDYATLKSYFDHVIEQLGKYGTEEFNTRAKTNFGPSAGDTQVRQSEMPNHV